MISIIIPTRNRPKHVKECLDSILKNTFQGFEILVVDQSDDNKTERVVNKISSKKIRYFKTKTRGKARGLNLMVDKARFEILAFTDDDCIVDKNWLRKTNLFYKKYPQTAGVFGNVLPYMPYKNKDKFYTSTFVSPRVSKQSDPYKIHWKVLGIGNNMSFRKSVITKVGYFKEWLGPGSIAWEGEETDLIYRVLSTNHILMTNPEMFVYHNRWLTKRELLKMLGVYSCGMSAFCTYYLFSKGNKKVFGLIKDQIATRIKKPLSIYFKIVLGFHLKHMFYRVDELTSGLWELYCLLRGFVIGAIFGIKDRLHTKYNSTKCQK